ncbi:hypothetical protein HH310_02535 [Actinoplanes sp. TBRC 11911]|uniref:hypothetical protein n=1 Tax=Actinoplanes sp. TBRC 11911 TaxID=2729386 RepID=UPI00145E17F8|nr:hypothetical protein [Actinoplanes sp. TBRC 11911]NMO50073.1 hypothetical protein [Actinoplanes sp. TBRC 11911]
MPMPFLLLVLLAPAALLVTIALARRGYAAGRTRLRRTAGRVWLWNVAAILGTIAMCWYAVGLLAVGAAVVSAEDGGTDSSPLRPCRTPGKEERALHVVDYSVRLIPLRFVCVTRNAPDYAAESVPNVNPAVLGFTVAAVACAGTAFARPRTVHTLGVQQ